MEFSELVDAVKKGEKQRVNEIIEHLTKVLVGYLRHQYHADRDQALDTVQNSLIDVLDAIKQDQIEDKENIFSYTMQSCIHNLIKLRKYEKRTRPYDYYNQSVEEPNQLRSLVDRERLEVLYECKDQLKPEYRKYVEYWFERPGVDARSVANHFNISVENAWVRRHRIIKELKKCWKKKNQKSL